MHPQTYKLVLNNPCKEDWNSMGIIEAGRHCELCSKDVIDFSSYSKEAIIDFFVANQGKAICGRMTKIQMNAIEIDRYLLDYNISFWKKFLIVFLIVFGYELFGASFVFAQVVESDTLNKKISTQIQKDTTVLTQPISDSVISKQLISCDTNFLAEQPKDVVLDTASEKINATDKLKIHTTEGSTSFDIYDSQSKLPTDLSMMVLGGMGLEYIDKQQISILEPIIEGKFELRVISGCFGDGRSNNNNSKENIKLIVKSKSNEEKTPNKESQNDTNLSFILPEEIKKKKKKKNAG
jgi:hypothetical protein